MMKTFALFTLASAAFAQKFNTAQNPGAAPTATVPAEYIPVDPAAPLPAYVTTQTDVPQSTPTQPAAQPADNSCAALHFVYARGTHEVADPYGILGNALFNATLALVPEMTGYGVDYPADLDCQSRQLGGADTAAHLASQHAKCPDQKFALTGVSQGADVLHFALAETAPDIFPSIVAIALFGDPGHRGQDAINPLGDTSPAIPAELDDRLKQSCAHEDPVCSNNGTILSQHGSYVTDMTYVADSAAYIKSQFDSGGTSGPQPSLEGPGTQTEGNIAAILQLSNLLASVGVKQTCNGTTTSYIHPELFATRTGSSSASSTTASASRSGGAAVSGSAAPGSGATQGITVSLFSVMVVPLLSFVLA